MTGLRHAFHPVPQPNVENSTAVQILLQWPGIPLLMQESPSSSKIALQTCKNN